MTTLRLVVLTNRSTRTEEIAEDYARDFLLAWQLHEKRSAETVEPEPSPLLLARQRCPRCGMCFCYWVGFEGVTLTCGLCGAEAGIAYLERT